MRFSIRSLLILILISAAAVAYYLARRPLRIPVAAVTLGDRYIEDAQRPEFVVRSFNKEKIRQTVASWREHRRQFFPTQEDMAELSKESYDLLKQDLSRYGSGHADQRVVGENKEEFKKIAIERMSDTNSFHVGTALEVLRDIDEYQIAIDTLTNRFLKRTTKDPPIQRWPFDEIFYAGEEHKKYLGTKSEFIAEIHRLEASSSPVVDGKMQPLPYQWLSFTGKAGAEARLKQLSTYIAADTSRDDALATRVQAAGHMLCLVKGWKLNIGNRERNAILELCKETLAANRTTYFYGPFKDQLSLVEQLHAYLEAVEPENLQELKEIVFEACSQKTPPLAALEVLTEMAAPSDADALRQIIRRSRSYSEMYLLIGAPKRLGIRKEAEQRLAQLVESGNDTGFVDSETPRSISEQYEWYYGKPDPHEEYARIRGQAAIPFFQSQIDKRKCVSSIERLAVLKKGTKDADTIAYLRKALIEVRRQSGDDVENISSSPEEFFSTAEWIIRALKTVGDEQADELWQQMPPPARPDQAMRLHWRSNPGLRVDDLAKFLNENLHPKQKITSKSIGSNPDLRRDDLVKFLNETLRPKQRVISKSVELDFRETGEPLPSKRNIASYDGVLNALEFAGLAYDDFMGMPMAGGMEGNVHRLVQGHVNLQAFSNFVSDHSSHIVIDDRLYEVQLDHWMNTADMADIFNAILADRGETRRFFLFKEIGLLRYHTVFVEPQFIRDLRDKFGMEPVEGYEYYLEH